MVISERTIRGFDKAIEITDAIDTDNAVVSKQLSASDLGTTW